jgi:hypothetical protein
VFRYRQLDYNLANPQAVGGDMTFGKGGANFLIDNPTAVAQAILTRLCLWQGEWFLNLQEGTPWMQQVLGHPYGGQVPDSAIRQRITTTPYVTSIANYVSTFDRTSRFFSVSCEVYTSFGQVLEAPTGALISPSGSLVIPMRVNSPLQFLPR